MDFRVHLMAQHARAHTAGIGQPDFSNQDLIVRDLTDEHLRARGQVVELRTADLRFSEPEATQFLNEVMDLRLDSGSVRQLEERTEGWIAGLQMAALLGTTCGLKELEGENLGNAGASSCVQTVVDWFGPIDFLTMDQEFAGTTCPANHNDASSPESKLVGAAIQTVPDVVKTTNPTNYIDPSDPPFLIQNGSADCNIPPVQSKNFADALSKVIGADKVTYTLIDGAGHGGSQFSTDANLKVVVDFLNKYLQ